jgi:hypothetical protein
MKKLLTIMLISIVSMAIPQPIQAATEVKAGAKCTKANSTQTVGTKKFTCVKSGTKLTWNKGVPISKPAAPKPTTTQVDPDPLPVEPVSPVAVVRQISGVQTRSESVQYVNDVPKARQLLRWSNQSIWGPATKLIVVYENMKTDSPPCDLSKSLCQGPVRVDKTVYRKIIEDTTIETIVLDNLEISAQYNFGVYSVSGASSGFDNMILTRSQFFLTSTEQVPGPPTGVTVGAVSGNIKIVSNMAIGAGYKLKVIAIGGKFGISTEVAVLIGPQEILIPAPVGLYQIVARLVTPSGINGDMGQVYSVTVS